MPGKTIKILLVENDKNHIKLVQNTFKSCRLNNHLQNAGTLKEAQNLLSISKFDIIITEFDLQDGKGVELVYAYHDTHPLVVMNAQSEEELMLEIKNAGAIDYVVKSESSLNDLPDTVAQALDKWSLVRKRKEVEQNLKNHLDHFMELVDERNHELSEINKKLHEEINDRKWMEKTLERVSDKFKNLVSNIPGIIFQRAPDDEWTMLFMSDEIEKISGYSSSEFVKLCTRSFLSIIHEDDIDMVKKVAREGIDQNKSYKIEYRIIDANNNIRWVIENGQNVADENGQVLWIDGAIFDITQQKQIEMEREQLNEELKIKNTKLEIQTDKLKSSAEELLKQQEEILKINNKLEEEIRSKSNFLANMSHELRSPLNSLLILAGDLAKNKYKNLTDDQIQSSEIIHKCGNDLLLLINDILDLSKIEAGKMTPFFTEIPIREIAKSINLTFRHITDNKGIMFNIEINEDIPEVITTDIQRLEQIIKNFISNAIKFTKEGGITLNIHRPLPEVKLTLSGLDSRGAIAISVIDTGIGIPEKKQKSIFEAFQQADVSTSQNYGGTGLGLSISLQLARLLGGEIQLKSKKNEGSTFTLYIPENQKKAELKKNESKSHISKITQETKTRAIKNIKFNGENILIVDDDMRQLFAIAKIIEDEGMIPHKASNGAKAVELLQKQPGIDIVLMDIEMPVMDGFQAMRNIRADEQFRELPIIIVSAQKEEDDVRKCISSGANDFLPKPINIDNMLLTMHKLLYK